MVKYKKLEGVRKPLTKMQKAKIGAGIGIVVFAVVLHKKKIATLTQMSQAAVQDTMWSSFDEGVRYGMALSRQSVEDAKEIGEYAFNAFDKAA